MIRILLVDDHAIIRDGIRALLLTEADLRVVGTASNGREALEILATTPADVLVVDINMPEMDGYETTRRVRELYPEARILVLSMLDHEEYIGRMLDAGALGYVLKNAGKDEIVFGIRSVAVGRHFLCAELGFALLAKLRSMTAPAALSAASPARKPSNLSRRETEVLQLIAEGFTTQEIADKLFTSKRTIETHRQNIIEKTQVKNTAALVKFALTQGLLE